MNMRSSLLLLLAPVLLSPLHSAASADASERREEQAAGIPFGPDQVYANIPRRDEFGRDQLAMFRLWNPDPVGRHADNLRALNPSLAATVRKAQADNPGLSFVIGSGKRDRSLQRKAYAWGWSMTPYGPHQSGTAVDLWPLDQNGRVQFDPQQQVLIGRAMMRAAAQLGVALRWGGTFQSFKNRDRSHFELAAP
jgi:peptidoglycan LD-endopeptidase CwlK